MTERKPPDVSFETWVDRQIREAQEAGKFDNLPGHGKPLPGLDRPYDELWWIKGKLASEGISTEDMLPAPLRLRKEIERLPEKVRTLPTESAVREAVSELNQRIMNHLRAPQGPQIPVRPVDADEIVGQWRAGRAATRPRTPPSPPSPAVPPRRRFRLFRRRK